MEPRSSVSTGRRDGKAQSSPRPEGAQTIHSCSMCAAPRSPAPRPPPVSRPHCSGPGTALPEPALSQDRAPSCDHSPRPGTHHANTRKALDMELRRGLAGALVGGRGLHFPGTRLLTRRQMPPSVPAAWAPTLRLRLFLGNCLRNARCPRHTHTPAPSDGGRRREGLPVPSWQRP